MKPKENKIIIIGAILLLSAVILSGLMPLIYDIWVHYISQSAFPIPFIFIRLYMFFAYIIGFSMIFLGPFIIKR
jgi:hypothetical protein